MSATATPVLIDIARLYYRDNLSQQQIADRLGLSRPTVSNALKRCLDQGIVEIHIREPDTPGDVLAGALERRYGLRKAIVTEAGAEAAARTRHLGRAAATFLDTLLVPGCRIGLSWGTTLREVVAHVAPRAVAGAEVAQLIGALGASQPHIDGFELARQLAGKLDGRYSVIQAPAVVRSAALQRLLEREPAIQEALRRAEAVQVAVIGISSDRPEHSALVRAGYLTPRAATALCRHGSVGHACGWHFDQRGVLLNHPVNDRIIGLSFEALRRIPTVIGVAGGPEKIAALAGALRSGILDVLVTDVDTARALDRAEPAAKGRKPSTSRRQP